MSDHQAKLVCDLLQSHRSIRKYRDQAIAPDQIATLLACGQMAATSSHLQATSVIRVTNQEKRLKIQELCGNQGYISAAPEFWVFCADLHRASQCALRQGETPLLGFTEHLLVATVDAALFAQNVVIAAEAMGLGICYIGAVRNHPQEIADMLVLPDQVYAVFGLCLGYPAHDPERKPRLPTQVVCMENQYDDSPAAAAIADYDALLKEYYQTRTGKTDTADWSAQMAEKLTREARPHMREFLHKRGLMWR